MSVYMYVVQLYVCVCVCVCVCNHKCIGPYMHVHMIMCNVWINS